MTFDQAKRYFKTHRAIATALKLSGGRISQIKDEGGFSYPLQCVLEKASGGVLVARYEDEPTKPHKAA